MPYIGKSPSAGVRQRYEYTATAGQTTFSGTDTGNLTLNYTDNNFVDVFQNGVLLKGGGTDYTATSGSSVVLTTGASVSDVIEIIVYDVFSVGNFYSRTDSDSRYALTTGATMSGALDLNGQELILDADADTSITADTDDQIDFKIGGSDKVIINSSGNVGIGTSSINRKLEISGDNNSGAKANYIRITDTDTTATAANQIGGIEFFSSDSSGGAGISASIETIYAGSGGGGEITFNTNASSGGTLAEAMRIDESGNLFVGKTSENAGTAGSEIKPVGGVFTADNDVPLVLNRNTTDGTVLLIKQANSSEGSIGVSGSTVSFDGFVGRHESSGIATSVAKGTVVSTIDELDVYATGETKAGQTRANHAKVKVSDSVGDKRVYGVVDNYTEKDKVMVSSVGIASVKVTGACVGGDLLESNGDGTAKVQSDDIVRSKTIGKVTIGNSNTGVKLVSCVLYCG